MDQAQVIGMSAGEALDTLVADKVLGKFVIQGEEAPATLFPGAVLTRKAWNEYLKKKGIGFDGGKVHPNEALDLLVKDYSTDIRWAIQVIDRMMEMGYAYQSEFKEGLHHWKFIPPDYEETLPWAKSTSMPEAICKAALVAVLTEEP